ncbi:MAG: hypothetical protein COB78_10785 [Hyphomicrobiales bacterium]|nr:MAG: hypothetical protein COB78_10785 [Hyphomicrobiales bacterium]
MADPVNLPAGIGYENFDMGIIALKETSRMEGRRVESVAFGSSYWTASYGTPFLQEDQLANMDAWLLAAASAGTTFLAHDLYRPRPRLENNGSPLSGAKALGGVFDGTADLTIITNSREVIIEGLPDGFQLSIGDYLEFTMSPLIRSLHEIIEPVTANSSGQAIVKFRHGLDTQHFTIAADVQFEKSSCVMQVLGNPRVPKGWGARRASFEASEVFFQ